MINFINPKSDAMKKQLIIIFLVFTSLSAWAQKPEYRIRGGINMQQTQSPDSKFSFTSHIGAMAGVRISTFGIYGEALFSTHDGNNWTESADYFVPSLLVRFYGFRKMYVEGGIPYYILASDQIDGSLIDFPDKEAGFYAGFGLSLKKVEIGARSSMNPIQSIQFTGSFRF